MFRKHSIGLIAFSQHTNLVMDVPVFLSTWFIQWQRPVFSFGKQLTSYSDFLDASSSAFNAGSIDMRLLSLSTAGYQTRIVHSVAYRINAFRQSFSAMKGSYFPVFVDPFTCRHFYAHSSSVLKRIVTHRGRIPLVCDTISGTLLGHVLGFDRGLSSVWVWFR